MRERSTLSGPVNCRTTPAGLVRIPRSLTKGEPHAQTTRDNRTAARLLRRGRRAVRLRSHGVRRPRAVGGTGAPLQEVRADGAGGDDRMRHRRLAARLRPAAQRAGPHRDRTGAGGRQGPPDRRALLQLRRPRRNRRRLPPNRGASTLWKALNQRFDIIGFDPRGVGQSTPSIDCKADQEKQGIYSQPFTTPFNVDRNALVAKDESYIHACEQQNGNILSHVSTANVARDMDAIRGLLGETKLNYFGYSYGTFLGATYASLFPDRYRAMVLDGPIDATAYINQPWRDLAEQTAGFERALGRFFQACAGNQDACSTSAAAIPGTRTTSSSRAPTRARSRRQATRRSTAGRRRRHQLRASSATSTRRSSGRDRPGARRGRER